MDALASYVLKAPSLEVAAWLPHSQGYLIFIVGPLLLKTPLDRARSGKAGRMLRRAAAPEANYTTGRLTMTEVLQISLDALHIRLAS